MPFTILDGNGPVIRANIRGEIDTSEVSRLQAAAAQAIRRCGKISALFVLENFQGWRRGDDWGDITFMTEHDRDVAKIAVVGEEQWRDLVYAFLAKGFRCAEIEYFSPGDLPKAQSWLEADTG